VEEHYGYLEIKYSVKGRYCGIKLRVLNDYR